MGTSLAAVTKETRLAHQLEFSTEQTRILAETVAKGCDQNELAFFLNVCKIKRLDPFTGQVHCVKRWDSTLGAKKMSIQIGIDGFRVIAVRSGELAGISEPEFDDEEEEFPKWARVTVFRYGRDNEKIPYAAKARYNEYVQNKQDGTPNIMWATKPYIMLGKCAEALALRKAFPDELSGMYSDEEMGQADNEVQGQQQAGKKPVTMPARASEKAQTTQQGPAQTQQVQGQATQQTQAKVEHDPNTIEVSGVIESVKPLKSVWWLTIKGNPIIRVLDKDTDADMTPGNFIKFRAQKMNNAQVGDFLAMVGLIELSPVEDGEPEKTEPAPDKNAPLAADAQVVADEIFGGKKAEDPIKEMVSNGTLTTAANLPQANKKPGTIGKKKAQRIYTLCTQNKANNHGFNEVEIKKILQVMYPAWTEVHLSDLETGMHEQFERWAVGEEDWQDYWKED